MMGVVSAGVWGLLLLGAAADARAAVPGTFGKVAPLNGATGRSTFPTVTWEMSSGATYYMICADTTNNNACDTTWTNVTNTSATWPGPELEHNTTYYWQVRAYNASGFTAADSQTWWSFTTVVEAPAAFTKTAPANGLTGVSTSPTLTWGTSVRATSYEYCADTTNDGACGTSWISVGAATSAALGGLSGGTTYYWHVRATNAGGTTYADSNTWWGFTTQPGAFAKAAPANGATGLALNPTVSWGASSGAASYEVCGDTVNNGACDTAWASAGSGTSATWPGPALAYDTVYYWQVRAVYAGGTTYADSNTWWSFTTQVAPPPLFNKSAPANGATGVSTSPTLTWGTSAGATSYAYCYDTTNDGACGGTWTSTGTSPTVTLGGLANGTTYYWQVRAVNAGGTTDADSNTWWNFTTQAHAPATFGKTAPVNGATAQATNPTLTWGTSAGAVRYAYCVDTTNDNECGGNWTSVGSSTSVKVGGLAAEATYYWQVRALNDAGSAEADVTTPWWSFTTDVAAPGTGSKVAAGLHHTCALTASGGVVCWGRNDSGQLGDGSTAHRSTPTAVNGLASGVTAIAVGGYHTCAIRGGGVQCWGANADGQLGDGTTMRRTTPTAMPGLESGVTAIAAGEHHTCALKAGGALVCWGRNAERQLGDGTTTNRLTPTAVAGLDSGVLAVGTGDTHTCALTDIGAALCWGSNREGQIGDRTTTDRDVPTQVWGMETGVVAITAGGQHTCAVTDGGALWCWGFNLSGQLGNGTTTDSSTPTPVVGMPSGVTAASAGGRHTCAVMTGGAVVCWGENDFGQVGDGTTEQRLTPEPVIGLGSGVANAAAGGLHSCAVMVTGQIRCWGYDAYGQIGYGTPTADWSTPTAVSELTRGAAAITAGQYHTCALTTGHGVVCWGIGLLGDGTGERRSMPTPVSGLGSGISAVAAGGQHTCALTAGGAVLCWGSNTHGQLGGATETSRLTPTPVPGLDSDVAAIAAGSRHTCAVKTNGSVMCWGDNEGGQIGDGTFGNRRYVPTAVVGLTSGIVAIAAGGMHTCALEAGGGVLCWGNNTAGQLGTPIGGNGSLVPIDVSGLAGGVAGIAAGYYHTCAVTTGGAVLCWGAGNYGQLGDPAKTDSLTPTPVPGLTSGAVGVAAGWFHTCAATAAGGMLCWGRNDGGQIGDGTTADRHTPTAVSGPASGIAAVTAGCSHTCALTVGEGVLCWGNNGVDQLGLRPQTFVAVPVGAYRFGGAVAVGSVTPASGPQAGGTFITITGSYFLQGATATIGGAAATWVSVTNPEIMMAMTGVHPPGTVDVVVTNPDGGHATFPAAFTYEGGGGGVIQYDFTGDRKSDVLWRHDTRGEVWLWPMDGAFKISESAVGIVADTAWEIRGQGDLNGDGMADLVWRHRIDGMIFYWPMNGAAPLAEAYVATVDPAYDIVGTGDVDGDGKADLLWRNPTNGELWIWLMDGATVRSQHYVETVDPGYQIKAIGDLDGNGKADLVWTGVGGDVWVWPMNGTTPVSQTYVGTVPDLRYQIQQVADFDGNGNADLLWWNSVQGDVWIWLMNGPVKLSENYVGTVPETHYRIQAAGDYDGDMKADLLWRNIVQGDVWVWLMDGTVKLSENYVGTVPDTGYQIVKLK